MKEKVDSPGVFVPPPVILAALLLAGYFMQKAIPLADSFFSTLPAKILGWLSMLAGLLFIIPSMRMFFKSKNTLATAMKSTRSLQSTGIYGISRNPIYVSLLFLYMGIAFLFGNWWDIILAPALFFILQEYVVKREEKYLERRFGADYMDYKRKVRRWL